jgi:hypothetical protein
VPGPPITYMLDGKQYVALAGSQGGRGAVVPNREAAQAPAGAAPAGGRGGVQVNPKLLVFMLDGNAPLPGAPAQ